MKSIQELVIGMLPANYNSAQISAEEIIEGIADLMYKREYAHLRDIEFFYQLPGLMRDTILLIDFDTELAINGLLWFLESSAGQHLEETIEVFKRIKAEEDWRILYNIKCELKDNGLSTVDLYNRIQKPKLYQIITQKVLLNQEHEDVNNRIEQMAGQLYLYTSERNIFDYLTTYIEEHQETLKEELRAFM